MRDIIEVASVTDCRHGERKGIVQVVGNPGVDCREGRMDRDEVYEAHNIPPVVFVLKRAVDVVVRGNYNMRNKEKEFKKSAAHKLEDCENCESMISEGSKGNLESQKSISNLHFNNMKRMKGTKRSRVFK